MLLLNILVLQPSSIGHKKIFNEWIAESGYKVDSREHFEILPHNYIPTDPNAKE